MILLIKTSIIRKSKRENFLRLFLENSLIRKGRPFTFYKKIFWKALIALPKTKAHYLIRPFTVKVNCQIRGIASIRKGLETENIPFLVSSYSIIASDNVSGRVSGENFKYPGKAIFANPEGSCFCHPEGSKFCQTGRVPILPIRRGLFLPIREVQILPIRRGPNFVNPEESCFCQSGGVLFCQNLTAHMKVNSTRY